jgi:hypothetical protein
MAIPQSAKTALQKKAKSSGISYGTLAKVYRRGQAAYMSSGSRPGVSMGAWAMGRVNSFIKRGHSQDDDLRGKKKKKKK